MTIDDNLDWGSHTEKIIKKVSSGIGPIKRVSTLSPKRHYNLLTKLLFTLTSVIAIHVWGNCGIILRTKLQKLHNRVARVLTFSDYDEDAGYLFELL